MGKHAILSPSAASRWIACTPSARLESEVPDKESEYAAEGTLAHSYGEAMILRDHGMISKVQFNRIEKQIKADPKFSPEMENYCEDYATFVAERFAEAKAHTPHAVLIIEAKLDMSKWVPEGFGTADVCIGYDGVLDFIDLKYGKGVQVDATNNKQLMLYGLGAYDALHLIYDFHTVRMTIYQPRLDHVSSFEMPVADLLTWADAELKPAAKMAYDGQGEFVVGSHCQFCRVRATCRAQYDHQMQLLSLDFQAPALIGPDEVAKVLRMKKDFEGWLKEVEDHAMNQAIHNGVKWPGMKLVEGRSNRMYTDEAAIASKLAQEGYPAEKYYKPQTLIGVGDMERLVTKKKFSELLGPWVIKPAGKATLVPEEDPRPELNSVAAATADFTDL